MSGQERPFADLVREVNLTTPSFVRQYRVSREHSVQIETKVPHPMLSLTLIVDVCEQLHQHPITLSTDDRHIGSKVDIWILLLAPDEF